MAIEEFKFYPVDGFKNEASFPNPATEQATREQMQRLHNQTRDKLNEVILALNGFDNSIADIIMEYLSSVGAGAGTLTGITMNGEVKGTTGMVDLGSVVTKQRDVLKLNVSASAVPASSEKQEWDVNSEYLYSFDVPVEGCTPDMSIIDMVVPTGILSWLAPYQKTNSGSITFYCRNDSATDFSLSIVLMEAN